MSQKKEILDDDFIVVDNHIFENASIIRRCCIGLVDVFVIFIIFGISIDILIPVAKINKNEGTIETTLYSVIILYYVVFEYFFKGRTIGKFITKTKVINKEGNPPALKQVFIRIFARYLPFEYLTILTRKDRTTLHDGASVTRVIKIKKK